MSAGGACKCVQRSLPISERAWEVTNREANYSAFNGYHRTPSAYSELHCWACGARWRSNAGYVKKTRDAKRDGSRP
jgi:hypothetical protein